MKLYLTPIKSIRKKCLDCCSGQYREVRECRSIDCPIWIYRFGKRPDEATIEALRRYYKGNNEKG